MNTLMDALPYPHMHKQPLLFRGAKAWSSDVKVVCSGVS